MVQLLGMGGMGTSLQGSTAQVLENGHGRGCSEFPPLELEVRVRHCTLFGHDKIGCIPLSTSVQRVVISVS